MNKFEYEDGRKIEFEDFKADPQYVVGCTMPPVSVRGYGHSSATLYITAADQTDRAKGNTGRMTQADLDKVRVGILRDNTNHPFPKGIYIPYKLSRWGDMAHQMDGLFGAFIFNDGVRDKTVKQPVVENV